jgi:hypothetical protein
LRKNVKSDSINERDGVHFEYDPKWEAYLNPERRKSKGILKQRNITLNPNIIIHKRNLEDSTYNIFSIKKEVDALETNLETLDLLDKKLLGNKSEIALLISVNFLFAIRFYFTLNLNNYKRLC